MRVFHHRPTETIGFMVLVLAIIAVLPLVHASNAADSYRLSAGDGISIQVFGEPDLSMNVQVDETGRITYPFLGDIALAGLTIGEVRERITTGLEGDYLVNPEVSVSITKYRNFFVNGEVNSPGSYPYIPGLTVYRAVSLAGGFAERASKSKIYLIPENNQEIRRRVELDSPVGPGDTLTVEQSFF